MQRIKKHNRKQVEKKKAEITSDQMFKMYTRIKKRTFNLHNLILLMLFFNRRYKWTQAEDQVLLFWKLGTMIIKQVKSHAFLSYGIKDVVRSIFGKVCLLIIKFEFLTD